LLVLSVWFAKGASASVVQELGGVISVEAEGFAPVKDGAKEAAREEAKRSAYRDALEKALGAYVEGITQVESFKVVKDKVFSQTSGIVKNFDIKSERVGDDGMLYITALCEVSTSALDGVLGPAAIDALGNPRIMVLMDERVSDKTSSPSTAEAEVLRAFEKAGYLIVDSARGTLHGMDLEAARKSADPEKLREVARAMGADVLITGQAYGQSFARQTSSGVDIYGVRTTIQLKAILANSAYHLASDTIEEKTKGVSVEDGAIKGFRLGASKAAGSMVNKVAYALVSGAAGGIPGTTVKVAVADVSFEEASMLKASLQRLDGVSGVYQRRYRDRSLEMDVVSDKTAESLAEVISGLGFEVSGVALGTVEAQGSSGD
jgi:predicted Fe-Mo cluster-binding NifX family protein